MTKEKLKKAQPATPISEKETGKSAVLAFWLFGLSGMAALIYEVVWTRALSLVLGSTTYALSTMLASFMAGLSLGAILGGWLADRSKRPVLLFVYLEAGIAVSGLLAISLINILPPLYAKIYYSFHQSFSSFSIIQFILCFMIMLVPTTLMGATFPAVCRINYRDGSNIGKETGGVYAVNTIGAILGALLAGFVLIPSIGVWRSNAFAAFLNLSVVLILLSVSISKGEKGKRIAKAGTAFITAFLISSILWSNAAHPSGFYTVWKYSSYDDYRDYLQKESHQWKKLFERENVQGNVKVYDMAAGRTIFINGRAESHEKGDVMNTSLLAYLPASANPEAKSFLSIGLGTGNTVHFASTLPHLKEIYSVEINPAVEEAVRMFFYPKLSEDKRIKFVTADARNYLSLIDKKYDIISSEPSYPVDQGFSHLFSKEFFDLVRSRLNEGGAFCQWIPTYLFSEEQMVMILKTFTSVFPNTTVWGVEDVEIIFIGAAGDLPQPVDEMKKRADEMLKEQGIEPGYSLYVNTGEIDGAIGGYEGPINTDDFPILEFYAARNMLTGKR